MLCHHVSALLVNAVTGWVVMEVLTMPKSGPVSLCFWSLGKATDVGRAEGYAAAV